MKSLFPPNKDNKLSVTVLILITILNSRSLGGISQMVKWAIDQSHSNVGFQVKHMMVSKVKGNVGSYTADVQADNLEDLTGATITF